MLGKREGLKLNKFTVLDKGAKYIFIIPGLVVLIILIAYPMIYLVSLALSRYDLALMDKPVFCGGSNFTSLLTDPYFLFSLKNTLVLAAGAVVLEFGLGLILALVLNERLRGGKIFRVLFIIPMMIPPIVVGLNFRLIYDPFGPLNFLSEMMGFEKINWIGSSLPAKLAIILTDTWQWSPFMFIILLAGLQSIPDYLYEAAKIDGASGIRVFLYITWPMLIPTAAVALIIRVIEALKLFDIIYMLTYGGPSGATETLSLWIYRLAFRFGNMGYASATAFVMFLILSVVCLVLIKGTGLEKRLEWGKE